MKKLIAALLVLAGFLFFYSNTADLLVSSGNEEDAGPMSVEETEL